MGCNTQVSEKYFDNQSNVLNNSNIVQYNLDIVEISILITIPWNRNG